MKKLIAVAAAGMFAFGCAESPTQSSAALDASPDFAKGGGGVIHSASLGGNDACEAFGLKPGCDANFSFHANMFADGSVKGQYNDQFAGGGGVHATLNCLNVIGNQAWVSGTIKGGDFDGLDVLTTVVDNGTSQNDPADQMSFSYIGTGIDCNAAPNFNLQLLTVSTGQVKVK